jgi:hypothetical protein
VNGGKKSIVGNECGRGGYSTTIIIIYNNKNVVNPQIPAGAMRERRHVRMYFSELLNRTFKYLCRLYFGAPEWRSGLRYYISVLEALLRTQV